MVKSYDGFPRINIKFSSEMMYTTIASSLDYIRTLELSSNALISIQALNLRRCCSSITFFFAVQRSKHYLFTLSKMCSQALASSLLLEHSQYCNREK
ncbi:hypothetical protein VNO77_10236 [Canavalia gladiata]|uniref:Uncharacterized protein n=1 Tax=Canavalia gladiata TaxID=3824 RepID=A0AAN9MAT0_CANGL